MKPVSAEALSNLLRSRGIPWVPIAELRSRLARATPEELHELYNNWFPRIARAVDDVGAIADLRAFMKCDRSDVVQQEAAQNSSALRQWNQVKVFATSGALCFELVHQSERQTFWVEAAPSMGGRRFAWDAKTSLQLAEDEQVELLGVILGYQPKCDFNYHGLQREKQLVGSNQQEVLFIQVREAGRRVSVPIQNRARFGIASLLLRSLQCSHPHLSSDSVMALCRVAAQHQDHQQ